MAYIPDSASCNDCFWKGKEDSNPQEDDNVETSVCGIDGSDIPEDCICGKWQYNPYIKGE